MIPDLSINEHQKKQADSKVVISSESLADSGWDGLVETVLKDNPEYNNIYTSREPLSTGHRVHISKQNPRIFSKKMFGEMRDSPMTGEFKHCEMCDITNDDGIIHVKIGRASCRERVSSPV